MGAVLKVALDRDPGCERAPAPSLLSTWEHVAKPATRRGIPRVLVPTPAEAHVRARARAHLPVQAGENRPHPRPDPQDHATVEFEPTDGKTRSSPARPADLDLERARRFPPTSPRAVAHHVGWKRPWRPCRIGRAPAPSASSLGSLRLPSRLAPELRGRDLPFPADQCQPGLTR